MTHNPLSPTRAEENRRLAEWLGFKRIEATSKTIPWIIWPDGRHQNSSHLPDFYVDEAANALLTDKLLDLGVRLVLHPFKAASPISGGTVLDAFRNETLMYSSNYVHRRIAIVKAALAYLEAQK